MKDLLRPLLGLKIIPANILAAAAALWLLQVAYISFFTPQLLQEKLTPESILFYGSQEITFRGTLTLPPEPTLTTQKLTVASNTILSDNFVWRPLHGTLTMASMLGTSLQYGDHIEVTCKIGKPRNPGAFSYCTYPTVRLLEHTPGNPLLATLFRFRERMQVAIALALPEPHASLLTGMLLGNKGTMAKNITENFRTTGVSHILAISGFNITLILFFLVTVLHTLHVSRRLRFWLTLTIIVLFIIMVGAEASVVRAGIMGGMMALAGYVGRRNQAWRALLLSAAVMVAFHPAILVFDLGFQLSFLAMLGLIYAAPMWEALLAHIMPTLWGIRQILATTLGAILLTLPLLAYIFHQISLISPGANLVVLPIVSPLTMIGVFGTLITMIFPFSAPLWGAILWPLLSYLIGITSFLAQLPYASTTIADISPIMLASMYSVIVIILWRARHVSSSPLLQHGL